MEHPDLTRGAGGRDSACSFICAPGMARSAVTGAIRGPWWPTGDLGVKVPCGPW